MISNRLCMITSIFLVGMMVDLYCCAWGSSMTIGNQPFSITFQSNGPGEFTYQEFGASGNDLTSDIPNMSSITAEIPAKITAVNPAGDLSALLPGATLPVNLYFDLFASGYSYPATVMGNTFSQNINQAWHADFQYNDSNNPNISDHLTLAGDVPLTISGTLNGTNATIQGPFSLMMLWQSGVPNPTDFHLNQPEILTINLATYGPLTIDQTDGMLNNFTGDWGAGLTPQTAVPEPSEALTFFCGIVVFAAFLIIDGTNRHGVINRKE